MAGILKVDKIQEANSGQGVELSHKLVDTSGNTIISENNGVATFGSSVAPSTNYTFRNKIINGDMRIDQRNAGGSVVIATGGFVIDRWKYEANQASKFTAGRNYGSVTPPVGFENYLGYKTTTAHTISSSDYFLPEYFVEGFDVADLEWGTANAKTITLSFWVYSSITGNHGAVISDGGATRIYPFLYAVNSANTWEYKTITIPGETNGTGWTTDNTTGLQIRFSLGSGSDNRRTPNIWSTNGGLGATGQVQLVETLNATWYITGVQLEKGTVATPFEHRPYGTELALCKRYAVMLGDSGSSYSYYGFGAAYSTTNVSVTIPLSVSMRAIPTVSFPGFGIFSFYLGTTIHYSDSTNMTGGNPEATTDAGAFYFVGTNLTVNTFGKILSSTNTTTRILLTAEL